MMIRTLFRSVFLITAIIYSVQTGHARQWEVLPDLPFVPVSLNWTIEMDEAAGGLSGTAMYTLRATRDDVMQIRFEQRDLEIISVTYEGETIPFVYEETTVLLALNEPKAKGDEFTLEIAYHAYPTFGYFTGADGSIWTSGMPGSVSSVLPVMRHPRLEFRTEILLKHPARFHGVANGTFVSRNVKGEQAETLFRSRKPISADGIRIAVGTAAPVETMAGNIPVRVYAFSNAVTSAQVREIQDAAKAEIQRISALLKTPYPFEALHILTMPESYGEAWGDAAGMIFLFDDYVDIQTQLKLATASQWLGQGLRGLSDRDWHYLSGYARTVAGVETHTLSLDTHLFGRDMSSDSRSLAGQLVSGREHNDFPLDDALVLMKHLPGVIGGNELDMARYELEMRPRPSGLPGLIRIPTVAEQLSAEEGRFVFRFLRSDHPETLRLMIDVSGEPVAGEYSAVIREVYADSILEQPVRFSEAGGELSLEVYIGLLNVEVSFEDVYFDVEKPLGFWLHQIRNGQNAVTRAEAARSLGHFATDPDLQTVILDLERSETDPVVKGALIEGMAGAGVHVVSTSGYISLLNNQHAALREAAIMAMGHLQGDTLAVAALTSHYEKTAAGTERDKTADVLRRQLAPEAFAALLQHNEQNNDDPATMLELLFAEGSIDAGLEMADSLLLNERRFVTRMRVLQLMEQHDNEVSSWQQRLPRLASDQDPRIRITALELSSRLGAEQRQILIRDRQAKESDPRVNARIREL